MMQRPPCYNTVGKTLLEELESIQSNDRVSVWGRTNGNCKLGFWTLNPEWGSWHNYCYCLSSRLRLLFDRWEMETSSGVEFKPCLKRHGEIFQGQNSSFWSFFSSQVNTSQCYQRKRRTSERYTYIHREREREWERERVCHQSRTVF